MSLQEVFNADIDFASLPALARRGWAWWIDELVAMAPPAWRDRLSGGPQILAEGLAGGGWRFLRQGQVVVGEPFRRGARKSVGLLASEPAVLVRELPTPRMSAADVRRMVQLDIDRLSPLPPDLVHFDIAILDRGEGGQRVVLGIVRRDTALRLVRQARADGLDPVSLGVATPDQPGKARFDFLPAVREAAGERVSAGVRRYWWGAVAALMVLNLALLVIRDMNDVAGLRSQADAQRPVVDAALALRRRVEGEDARRRALFAHGQATEPLRLLNALTEALPSGAWVQHLEWNGRTLHITGFKTADLDIAAALRGSGVFSNPRLVNGETSTGPTNVRPFDITADARQGGRP